MKTIKVCPKCQTPLIWTFCFPYCEYFCLNCGYKHGMLGAGEDIKLTKKLKLKKDIVDSIWKQLYGKGRLLPTGLFGCSNCKVTSNCKDHNSHLSKNEKEWNDISKEILQEIQGIFN